MQNDFSSKENGFVSIKNNLVLKKNDPALKEFDFEPMGNLRSSTGNNFSSVQSGNNEIKISVKRAP